MVPVVLTYETPVDEFVFILNDCLDLSARSTALGFPDLDRDLIYALTQAAGEVCTRELLPLNATGDRQGVRLEAGRIRTPDGFRQAYRSLVEGGLIGVAHPEIHGGKGLPIAIARAIAEIRNSACMAIAGYAELAEGAYLPIAKHGSPELADLYLPKIARGDWAGAMHLTEPQAGSDLSLLRTRAEPAKDDTFRIHGTKVFISCADQDLTDNVVNLVLARLPDAPEGIRGISLFAVSNHMLDDQRRLGNRNALGYTGIEEKMGLHGSVTGTIVHEGSVAHMVGKPNEGLNAIFSMVNDTRLGVGFQALGVAEVAQQTAMAYARERRQGRIAGSNGTHAPVQIGEHADVRRMLNRMRSFTGGARFLGLWTAFQLDIASRHADADKRRRAHNMASLLTGVVKAHFTDEACDCTDTAMQVFGGYGYIREQGLEQLYRDVRVTRIYEGTNNVIAQDFARRRLWLENGAVAARFCEMVESEAREAGERDFLSRDICLTTEKLRHCLELIAKNGGRRSPVLTETAHDLLSITAHIAMGWAWIKLQEAGRRVGHSASPHKDDLEELACYYSEWRIPETEAAFARIKAALAKPG